MQIPEGDVLVHAGDITWKGNLDAVKRFNEWLGELPHKVKIVIAGNHDFCFEKPSEKFLARGRLTNCIYLEDSGEEIDLLDGRKFTVWGSPWTPWFYDWAFNEERGPLIREHWDMIPDNTDIVVTHGPPYGYLDKTDRGPRAGCEELATAIQRIKPKIHVFGHIHEGYGVEIDPNVGTKYINASSCTLQYRPTNPPIVVDIDV